MSIGNSIDSDREQLVSLFEEELTLETSGLGHTYVEFKLIAINDKPLPENQNIYMYFYHNDVYSGPRPNYRGTLVAFDHGKYKYEKYAEFFYRRDFVESESDMKLSIHEVIVDLYQNTRTNG